MHLSYFDVLPVGHPDRAVAHGLFLFFLASPGASFFFLTPHALQAPLSS